MCSLESAAYLLQYDSVHGTWSVPVVAGDGVITIDGKEVKYTQEADPAKVDWPTEIVCDCTGKVRGGRVALYADANTCARVLNSNKLCLPS